MDISAVISVGICDLFAEVENHDGHKIEVVVVRAEVGRRCEWRYLEDIIQRFLGALKIDTTLQRV